MGIEIMLYISFQWTTEYLQVGAMWGHFGGKRKLEKILLKLHCIRWINKFRFILEAGKCERDSRRFIDNVAFPEDF